MESLHFSILYTSMRTVLLLISILLFSQCSERPGEPDFSIVNKFTQECLDKSIQHLTIISDNIANSDINKGQFDKARDNYKMAEPFVAYVNNAYAHRVNGPALPVFLEDNGRVLHPVGLQAIEEQIYGPLEDSLLLKNQIELTIGFLTNLKKDIGNTPFTAKRFFIAVHQQYLRIISLCITGFDTPTSLRG